LRKKTKYKIYIHVIYIEFILELQLIHSFRNFPNNRFINTDILFNTYNLVNLKQLHAKNMLIIFNLICYFNHNDFSFNHKYFRINMA